MAISTAAAGGALGGDVGVDGGLVGGDSGLLGGDGAGGGLAFDGGYELAGLYVVAFLDVEVRDTSESGGADVDVGFGLNLAGAADGGDEILAGGVGGDDGEHAGAAVNDGSGDDADQYEEADDETDNAFRVHADEVSSLALRCYEPGHGPGRRTRVF